MIVMMVVVRLLVVLLMVMLKTIHIARLLLAIRSSSTGSTSLLVLLMSRLLLRGSSSSRDENCGRGRQIGRIGQSLRLGWHGLHRKIANHLTIRLRSGELPKEMRLLIQSRHGHSACSADIRPAQLLILIVGLEGGAA